MQPVNLFYAIDIAAVGVCAVTATLEAGRREMDLFGVLVVGLVAGIGGGTVRDVLLGRLPVFWVYDPLYVVVALGAATFTFFASRRVNLPRNFFLLPDAVGLALFTVIGVTVALKLGTSWIIAALMGVITAVSGGIIRDILCNEIPLVFRSELYATASLAGGLLMMLLLHSGLPRREVSLIAMAAIFVIRVAAIRWRIHLPRFRSPT
jgi:uncharacterized membrane protein YeiH